MAIIRGAVPAASTVHVRGYRGRGRPTNSILTESIEEQWRRQSHACKKTEWTDCKCADGSVPGPIGCPPFQGPAKPVFNGEGQSCYAKWMKCCGQNWTDAVFGKSRCCWSPQSHGEGQDVWASQCCPFESKSKDARCGPDDAPSIETPGL